MGYTHYWTTTTAFTESEWIEFKKMATGILCEATQAPHNISLADDDDEPRSITDMLAWAVDDDRIRFNGCGADGHETFAVTRAGVGRNFCKTARKPYDTVVVAVLMAAANACPVFTWTSDGDGADHAEGAKLYNAAAVVAGTYVMDGDPFSAIEADGYKAAHDRIIAISRLAVAGDAVAGRAGTTYLRVLVHDSRERLDGHDPHFAVNEAVRINYPSVLAGVATPEIADDPETDKPERKRRALERNRRSNFARTAASALRSYVGAGGDLDALDISTVTKSSLIAATAELNTPKAATVTTLAEPLGAVDLDAGVRACERAFKRYTAALRKLNSPTLAAHHANESANQLNSEFIPE